MPTPRTTDEEGFDSKGLEDFILGKNAQAGEADSSADADASQGAPELQEFRYKGRVLRVSPEDHAALEDLLREARGNNGRLGNEVARLRDRLAHTEGALETLRTTPSKHEEPLSPPDARLAQTDFPAWQAQWVSYQAAERERERTAFEERYETKVREEQAARTTESRERQWADRFYNTHPELNKPYLRSLVREAYFESSDDITSLPDVREQYDLLAERAADKIRAVRESAGDVKTKKAPPKLEGGGGSGAKPATTQKTHITGASWSAARRAAMGAVGRGVQK